MNPCTLLEHELPPSSPHREDLDLDFPADLLPNSTNMSEEALFDPSFDHLHSFYEAVFNNPSYPRAPVVDVADDVALTHTAAGPIRCYRSDYDVLVAYYIWLHPTFPILPGPEVSGLRDCSTWSSPTSINEYFEEYEPSSPLLLSILAILALIPSNGAQDAFDGLYRRQRQTLARSIATIALECVDVDLHVIVGTGQAQQRLPIHSQVPIQLEPVMALCILSAFEYLQHGDIEKMARLSSRAIQSAQAMSLHMLGDSYVNDSEAARRTWWMACMCNYNVSIVNCTPPSVAAHDARYTTPYPTLASNPEAFPIFIRAEQTLVLATLFLVGLLKGFGRATDMPVIFRNLEAMHDLIETQLAKIGYQHEPNSITCTVDPSEKLIALTVLSVARIRLDTARIKIHRYFALIDSLDVLRGLNNPQVLQADAAQRLSSAAPNFLAKDAMTRCPFSRYESIDFCLKSALRNARAFETLPSPYSDPILATMPTTTVPLTMSHFACSAMQCAYTLLMINCKATLDIKSNRPTESTSEMLAQSKLGLASIVHSLSRMAITYESGLFEPLALKRGPALKHRILLAPLTNWQSHADGTVSQDDLEWLTRCAAGGFSMVMTCAANVHPYGKTFPGQMGIHSDKHLEGLSRIAKTIREHGGVSSVQLHHGGIRASTWLGGTPVGPSDISAMGAKGLSLEEVHSLRDDFIAAAHRAERAGFDGVEVHAAFGWIITQFLSPLYNQRTDRYGGSFRNRVRLLFEIIDGIREKCRPDFQIGLRLSMERHGMILSEIRQVAARALEEEKIDYLDLAPWDCSKMVQEEGLSERRTLLSIFTELPRSSVKIGASGKIMSTERAMAVLDAGCDFVMLGKAAILDPEFPKKALQDPEYQTLPLPVTEEHLKSTGLSGNFIDYLRTWEAFVVD
ncbi:FMN-linked oxidoreductase [Corynespora cassiicola Philippines]|uniref:FMN-linked oxidoreductase n=1 Tax=Corynespora cassiicola Philippines TaxID=1448308 RepID=A0A2T2N814_CORCC|nr:FMN-linked oxidoreductase [Corynespora cassiicola Philippines]